MILMLVLLFIYLNSYYVYAAVQGCPSAGRLTAGRFTKSLVSPNYPGHYGAFNKRLSCSWLIQADDVYDDVVIQFKFHNVSIEPYTGCWRDAVTIFDGPKAFYRPLVTLCGSTWRRGTVTSTRREILVKFSTDFRNNNFYGFKLDYWVAKKPLVIVKPLQWTIINYVLLAISIVLLVVSPGCLVAVYTIKRRLLPKLVQSWMKKKN